VRQGSALRNRKGPRLVTADTTHTATHLVGVCRVNRQLIEVPPPRGITDKVQRAVWAPLRLLHRLVGAASHRPAVYGWGGSVGLCGCASQDHDMCSIVIKTLSPESQPPSASPPDTPSHTCVPAAALSHRSLPDRVTCRPTAARVTQAAATTTTTRVERDRAVCCCARLARQNLLLSLQSKQARTHHVGVVPRNVRQLGAVGAEHRTAEETVPRG
jgi:hypothetical protein